MNEYQQPGMASTSGRTAGAEVASNPGSGSGHARSQPSSVAATVPLEASLLRETRVPICGARRTTAEATVASVFTAPRVTAWVTVDVTETVKLLERLKGKRDFRDARVSPLLAVARAVCLALPRTPELNASWDEENQEILYKKYVNLGITSPTPKGLIVPNIKSAHLLLLPELARALSDLTGAARIGLTREVDVSGGSFTITDLGGLGLDAGTAIINPGESGILCFGAIRSKPWVVARDGKKSIEARHVMTLGLTSDHRIVDGVHASRLLADVVAILEDPDAALASTPNR